MTWQGGEQLGDLGAEEAISLHRENGCIRIRWAASWLVVTQAKNLICAVYQSPKILTQLQICTKQRPPLGTHDVTFDPQYQILRLVGQKADINMLDAVWSIGLISRLDHH